MSQDPKTQNKSTSSQQAAQSLNQLLDQCETQRSQLDAFLAGFEKRMAGKTIIGENSIIGGNAWVTASVPPNSTVFHTPEIKIKTAPNV